MNCIKCKRDFPDDYTFCPYCGAQSGSTDNVDDLDKTLTISKAEFYENYEDYVSYEDEEYEQDDDENSDESKKSPINEFISSKSYDFKVKINDLKHRFRTSKNNINLKSINLDSFKSSIKSNKKMPYIAGSCAALIIVVVIFTSSKGSPINDDKVKDYLINQNLSYSSMTITATEDNIKDFELVSRNTDKGESDVIFSKITFNLGDAEVYTTLKYTLTYDPQSKSWIYSDTNDFKIESIIPTVDINAEMLNSLFETLKFTSTSSNWGSFELGKDGIKEISNVQVNDNVNSYYKKDVTADLLLSNGLIQTTVSAKFILEFSFEDSAWKLSSTNIKYETLEPESLISDLTDEDKKNIVLNTFNDNDNYTYKSYDNIKITKNNITNFSVNNFTDTQDNKIRIDFNGTASMGALKSISFSGNMYINKSLSSSTNTKEVQINNIEFEDLNEENLKQMLLQCKIEDTTITSEHIDTLKSLSLKSGSDDFSKVFKAKMKINNKTKKILIYADLNYSQDNKTYAWSISKVEYD